MKIKQESIEAFQDRKIEVKLASLSENIRKALRVIDEDDLPGFLLGL